MNPKPTPGQAWHPSEDKPNPNPFAGIVPSVAPRCEIQPDSHPFVGKSGFVAPTESTETGFGPPLPPAPPAPTAEEIAATPYLDADEFRQGMATQDVPPAEPVAVDDTPDLETQLQIKEAALTALADEKVKLQARVMQLEGANFRLEEEVRRQNDEIKRLKTRSATGYEQLTLKVAEQAGRITLLRSQITLLTAVRPANVIEIKTLIHDIGIDRPDANARADQSLSNALADGWTVMNIAVNYTESGWHTRIVTLRRDPRPVPLSEQTVIIDTDVDPASEPKFGYQSPPAIDQLRARTNELRRNLEAHKARSSGKVIYGQ